MTTETKPKLTLLNHDERQALATVRKLLQRKPEVAEQLMKDMTKQAAVNVLLSAKKELQDLHLMAQALVAASGIIVKMDQPKESNHD